MYRNTGYATHNEYIQSLEWLKKKQRISTSFPLSRYCFVCDCTGYLDLHHEGYESVPNEKFLIDLFWLCDSRCKCGNKCHKKVGFVGRRAIYDRWVLKRRRLYFRRLYVRQHLRPSTLLWFIYRFFYRLLF